MRLLLRRRHFVLNLFVLLYIIIQTNSRTDEQKDGLVTLKGIHFSYFKSRTLKINFYFILKEMNKQCH